MIFTDERFAVQHRRDQSAGRIFVVVTDRLTGKSEEWPDYLGIDAAIRQWQLQQIQDWNERLATKTA